MTPYIGFKKKSKCRHLPPIAVICRYKPTVLQNSSIKLGLKLPLFKFFYLKNLFFFQINLTCDECICQGLD